MVTSHMGAVGVISVVFVIGVLNLLLGFALAVVLERQITVPMPAFGNAREEPDVIFELPAHRKTRLTDELRDTLPKRWLDLLDRSDVDFSTFAEAATEILRLEVSRYRRDLLDAEDRLHQVLQSEKREAVAAEINALVAVNEEWVDQQKDAVEVMARCQNQLGAYVSISQDLENTLLDQTAMIQQECDELLRLRNNCAEDGVVDCVVRSLGKMTTMAHQLRDQINSASLTIIREEGRLHSPDLGMKRDDITGLQNRVALEVIFENWWREDTDRSRQVSAALIDVDRFGDLNVQLTTRVADRVLKNLAIYLEQLCDSKSGLDRVYHYAGQQFFIFFGDTGPRTAASKIEKIRQTLEVTRFEVHGKRYALTVRAGVAAAKADDDVRSFFKHLEELADSAKHAGRNRTALEDASGAGVVQPETMDVKKRVIKVE